jgi:hypothetical protein
MVNVHHADVEYSEEMLGGIVVPGTGDKIQYFLGPGPDCGVELCAKRQGFFLKEGAFSRRP